MKKNIFLSVLVYIFINSVPVKAQWQQINAPYGGYVSCFAAIGTTVFTATGAGVFRTFDNGANWTKANNGLKSSPGSLAVTGTNIFAGTNYGVFLSVDSGNNWISMNKGLTDSSVAHLAVSGTNIFASTYSHVYMSPDTGKNWIVADSGLASSYIHNFGVNGTNVFAATDNGVFLTADSGASWHAVNNGFGYYSNDSNNVQSFAIVGSTVFVLSSPGQYYNILYSTSDNGAHWTLAHDFNTNATITIAGSGNNLFAAFDYKGVEISSNGGLTWRAINIGIFDLNVHIVAAFGSNVFAGSYGGIYASTNNGTLWNEANNGLTATGIGAFAELGTHVFAATGSGVFLSTDSGASWTNVYQAAYGSSTLAVMGTNIFAGSPDGIALSTDSGTTWTDVNNGLTDYYISSLVVNDAYIFASSDVGVFRSDSTGAIWTLVNNGMPATNYFDLARQGNNIFVYSANGSDAVYVTKDNGASWTLAKKMDVSSLAGNETTIFAGTWMGGGIYLSNDTGNHWTTVNNGLTDSTDWMALAANSANVLAWNKGGVFLYNNIGANWGAMNDGLPDSSSVNVINILGKTAYACTNYGTVWKYQLPDVLTSIESTTNNNNPFVIYPNPATNQLTIHTSSFHNEAVTVSIMNVLGQEASRPVPFQMERGDALIDVSKLPAGMYFLQLKWESGSVVKKFVKE